ncbi:hypothetical protein CYY_001475 [Polysphondylium violaceum]|uniref:UbiA prenyltransferase family protein n=1 Tax=Polysphondylium violaceum TaxID=133409 RepID=A0A8J4UW59_9MYCE|nr:hypothetical protein CYY_001475 [Polysphondylium violaceum]
MNIVQKYCIANRIWVVMLFVGFTSIILSIIYKEGKYISQFRTLSMLCSTILTITFSSLVNTYYDFLNGVDRVEIPSCDRTLFDYGITLQMLVKFSFVNIFGAFFFLIPIGFHPLAKETFTSLCLPIIIFLLLLSYFYTAPPIALKYRGLGASGIVGACFFTPSLIYYSNTFTFGYHESELVFPLSYACIMFCLFVYHGRTMKDIDTDISAGVKTHCVMLGKTGSYFVWFLIYFTAMFYCSYLSMIKSNIFLNLPWISLIPVQKIIRFTKEKREYNLKINNTVPKIPFLCMLSLAVGVLLGPNY